MPRASIDDIPRPSQRTRGVRRGIARGAGARVQRTAATGQHREAPRASSWTARGGIERPFRAAHAPSFNRPPAEKGGIRRFRESRPVEIVDRDELQVRLTPRGSIARDSLTPRTSSRRPECQPPRARSLGDLARDSSVADPRNVALSAPSARVARIPPPTDPPRSEPPSSRRSQTRRPPRWTHGLPGAHRRP